ncbi:hypothetical protein [Azospirillum sp. sgz301742]
MISEPLAFCSETGRLVTVDSRLVPAEYGGASFWEFSFEIAVLSEDGSEESFTTQDREIARGYIPESVRSRVMDIVGQACRKLLDKERPSGLYRVTKGRSLPGKAMRKHETLTAVCVEAGYGVTQTGTDPAGRTFWAMSRTVY